jgi:hypothetical protein
MLNQSYRVQPPAHIHHDSGQHQADGLIGIGTLRAARSVIKE